MLKGGGAGRHGLRASAALLVGAGLVLPVAVGGGGTPAPVLTSLDFDLADAAGGDLVTITGTDLGSATLCTVGGTSASIFLNTPTSLTFTMPAKTAGSHNVQITTAAGSSNTLSIEVWAPTCWRAPFAGSPWSSTSGSYSLTEATTPPTAGSGGQLVNGYAPAIFDGVNDQLANGSAMTAFVTAGAYFWWALFYSSASGGVFDITNAYANPALWTSAGAWLNAAFRNDSGTEKIQVLHADPNRIGNEHAISLNAWNLICGRYDGSNIRSRLNSGSVAVSGAIASVGEMSGTLGVGRNYDGSARYTGRLLELGFVAGAESDARFGQLLARANARYALSL